MSRSVFEIFAAVTMSTVVSFIAPDAAATTAGLHGGTHPHAGIHHHHRHPAILHRANGAASAGDRHVAHPMAEHHAAFGAPVFETPQIIPPYPYAGHLAGDGLLGTGILDSNVLRAFGIVRN